MENDKLSSCEKEMEINKLILELRDNIYQVRESFDLRPPAIAEIWSSIETKYRDGNCYLKVTLPQWVEGLLWAMKCIDVSETD